VTVYRSSGPRAREDAAAIVKLLASRGVHGELVADTTPPASAGEWTVRVATADAAQAEELIATNPPSEDDHPEGDSSDPRREAATIEELLAPPKPKD